MASAVSVDLETYSEAGYFFDGLRWRSVAGAREGGLPAVGAAVYAEHPSAEVLVLCYSFDGGATIKSWVPGMPAPMDLLEHVRGGGVVVAFNSMFEWLFWDRVCVRKYGWPILPLAHTRDTAASARAFGLPGALKKAAEALGTVAQKDSEGVSLINLFTKPRSPTKNDPRLRTYLGHEQVKAQRFYEYCAQDVRVETEVAAQCPELSGFETVVWTLDQEINERGVFIDVHALRDCQAIFNGFSKILTRELVHITNGRIQTHNQTEVIKDMFAEYGIYVPDVQAQTVADTLADVFHEIYKHPWAQRVFEIRRDLASASVAKLGAIDRRICSDGRVRGLFAYCGAERTGRWAGRGPQPQNLPRGNSDVGTCGRCGMWQGTHRLSCFGCGGDIDKKKWEFKAGLAALESFQDQNTESAIHRWGDVLGVISGCLRSLFVAESGKRFLCSDFRAIEAVVLAALAGEEWRLEVFRTHGRIYEQSASKITGIPLEEYLEYKRVNGQHHPDRAMGKVAELASGYGGGYKGWKAFGADKYMRDDDEIKANVKKWRIESPMIAGDWRRNITGMWKGLEDAAIQAIEYPGHFARYRDIWYQSDGRVLRCTLPSGRALSYHTPMVVPGETPWGSPCKKIKFHGYNSNPKYGAIGWRQLETYGGRLTENVVQAASRDIMAHAMLNLRQAGYSIVLHVHDEIVCEEVAGFGSLEEVERLMGRLPDWATGWPVIAHGGWEGGEYRKD